MLVQVLSVSLSERSVLWDPGHRDTQRDLSASCLSSAPTPRTVCTPWSTLFHQPALELVMLLCLLGSFCHLPMSPCMLAAVAAARSLSCCPSSQEEPRDSAWDDFTPQSLASLTHCPSDSPLPLHLLVFNAFATVVFLHVVCAPFCSHSVVTPFSKGNLLLSIVSPALLFWLLHLSLGPLRDHFSIFAIHLFRASNVML